MRRQASFRWRCGERPSRARTGLRGSGPWTPRASGRCPLLDLSDDERAQIASRCDELDVPVGAELASQGEFGYSFFIVDEGTADVSIDGERCGELAAGDVFGEIGLLVTGRRTASVTASTPMRLLALFDQDFRRLTAGIPAFDRCLRHLMASRFAVRSG